MAGGGWEGGAYPGVGGGQGGSNAVMVYVRAAVKHRSLL